MQLRVLQSCELGKRLIVHETCTAWRKAHPEEAVAIVERWAAEHPVKTRQSAFMEQWPNARISNVDEFPVINPCGLDSTVVNECDVASCSKCRSKFWLAEVEDGSAD